MRVLFISPAVPSNYYGRRPYNMLRTLASRHQFHVLAFSRDNKDESFANTLRNLGMEVSIVDFTRMTARMNCARGFLGEQPLRMLYCKSMAMAKAVRQICKQFNPDLVHIDRLRMGQYLTDIQGLPSLVDFTDAMCLYLDRKLALPMNPASRIIDRRERRTMPGFERWVLERCNRVIISGDLDAEYLRKDHPGFAIDVVENTVDLDEFVPRKANRPGECLFVGSLFYYPNVDATEYLLDEIWPRVMKKIPGTRLWVGGAKPVKRVRKACARHGIQLVPDIPDMASVFYTEDVLLSPIRIASGTRFKLLEALSAEMGVVSTALGAEGLPLVHGEHLLMAEDPEAFAEATVELMRNHELRRKLGQAGRESVREKYSRHAVAGKLDAIYHAIVKN